MALKVVRGDTLTFDVYFKNQDGTPIDITGASVYFTIKKNLNDSDSNAIYQTKQTTHVDPTNGHTRITVPASTTKTWTPGKYYYDLQVVHSDGTVQSTLYDLLEVILDITQTDTL